MLLRRVVEAHVEIGQPVGSKWLSERDDVRWSPSTIRYELAALEELGYLNHPHTSAGRVPTDAGYRQYADSVLREPPLARDQSPLPARAVHHAPRGRPGDARDHLDAVAGDRPAGGRIRAAPAHGHDQAHRGAPASATDRARGRHHLDRSGHQARLHVRGAGRRRPCRLGRELSERAPGRDRPGRAHTAQPARLPGAVGAGADLPGSGRAGVLRPGRHRRGHAVRGRRRPPAGGQGIRRHLGDERRDPRARAPGHAARGAALGAERARGLPADRDREHGARVALGKRRGRELRALATGHSAPSA